MTDRRQLLISIIVVAAGATGAAVYTLKSNGEAAQVTSANHNHGASASGGDDMSPIALDPVGARRIGVTYATVVRKPFERAVETVGNVKYDETRLVEVNPKIEGWVERLFVDFTGAPVKQGQPLLAVYSPMLVSAQEELILARRLVESSAAASERSERSERSGRNAQELLDAARRRLRYWDVPEDEIARIERAGVPQKTITLRSPASGIVVEKNVVEGGRIMPGMVVYAIADLSRVWIEGEVFEKDLSLVRLGQNARAVFDAYSGERFDGVVTYVYPTVSPDTRTGRIRLELANPDLRLKPGMYARIQLSAGEMRDALVIPRAAVHYTGERALVFLREADGTLRPREITTGLVSGDEIEVVAGLIEGDVVVSSANFLIDAESNMGSSMQSMPGMDSSGKSTPPKPVAPDTAGGKHSGH
jgi:Cu(I)/Ag(I) efflux system membrane fusion protein